MIIGIAGARNRTRCVPSLRTPEAGIEGRNEIPADCSAAGIVTRG